MRRRLLLLGIPSALLLPGATGAAGAAPAQAQAAPSVQQVWARPTVPGQDMGGAFLRIVGGTRPDRLLGASSPLAMEVELHSMRMEGSTMRMRAVEAVDIPAGQVVELQPGGLHLMIMGLNGPLKLGSRVPLALRFEKAGTVQVEAEVALRPPAGGAAPLRR